MHRPILITPAIELPISVEDVARLLNKAVWDGDDMEIEDAENIEFAIRSAVDHYQGWNDILGISLAVQEWRQDFDHFERELRLPVGPVLASGMSVAWGGENGAAQLVDPSNYVLHIDLGGRSTIRFVPDFRLPAGRCSITYQAGYAELPHDIKAAIVLRVQVLLDEAATGNSPHLERAEASLIATYRRMAI